MKTVFMSACMVGVVGFVIVSRADDRKGGDRQVHKLMERTHEGRRSPYGQLRQIVAGPGAPWPAIEQAAQGFDPMCRALLESTNADIKDSADGYVDAVKEIRAAVKRRDSKGVADGFQSLKASCGDCHFKDGVGGQLDHEEEDEEKDEDEDQETDGERR